MPFEVDHIIPPVRGGTDDGDNLALACRACNLFKADHLTGDAGAPERLFHPRRDDWAAHFHINEETGEITGSSLIGEATVTRLRMTAPPRLQARRLWRALGLFP